jgi:transposase InsO family protein
MGAWVGPAIRDEIVGFIERYAALTGLAAGRLVAWIGIGRDKWHAWKARRGQANRHNAFVPREFWLEPWERRAIMAFFLGHPGEGYRRLTYMMLDADVVAVSPSSTYRVLKDEGLLTAWNRRASKKGTGFVQPLQAHAHWHIDITHLNLGGTFYYFCGVIDGYSRYLVAWDIRSSMKELDVEILLERARARFPEAHPRIISDNGPQFVGREFKEFVRDAGMTHVRTSPYYPQSNGKFERFNQTYKVECIRPQTPLSDDDARRITAQYVDRYNNVRLHGALGYIAPRDQLEGRAEAIRAERRRKLHEAHERRKARFDSSTTPEPLIFSWG